MSTETLLLLIIVALIVVALPYSKSWGYTLTGVSAFLLVVFLVWAIAGQPPILRRTVGDDIRDAGRDVADSVRRAVQ